ncbi:hypothetical protein [Finegoldia magna]|jgi:hypothetical protein|uniref:hypothetical protein n=1 Tax=Finegoldia magna TaxID=1260 RepID=UPI00399B5DE3
MEQRNNYIKGVSKNGFRFSIKREILESYDFFELLGESEDNPLVMPKILKMLLGNEQKKKFIAFLSKKNENVSVAKVTEELESIFKSIDKIKN